MGDQEQLTSALSTEGIESIPDRLMREGLQPLAAAFKRAGLPLSIWTAMRHARVGVLVDGQRVRLQAIRLSGRWFTSVAAVRRHVAAIQPREDSANRRILEREAADRYLESVGLGR
jgi:hypothetical protein